MQTTVKPRSRDAKFEALHSEFATCGLAAAISIAWPMEEEGGRAAMTGLDGIGMRRSSHIMIISHQVRAPVKLFHRLTLFPRLEGLREEHAGGRWIL